jgi:hypothetical protein
MSKLLPVFVIVLYLCVALFRIEEIPGDWYGDIDVAREYVDDILSLRWPMQFVYGAGPAQYYFASPIFFVLSNWLYGYELLKVVSVIMGLVGLWGIYMFGKEVEGRRFGMLMGAVASISFWYLVQVRLGNLHIALIPGLVGWILYFYFKFIKEGKLKYSIIGSLLSVSGLLIYPGTFILPLMWSLLIMVSQWRKKSLGKVAYFNFLVMIPVIVMFVSIIRSQTYDFTSGYIGSKLFGVEKKGFGDLIIDAGVNFSKALGMLHIRGDNTFRMNVPGTPQLDLVSGLLLIVGLILSLKKAKVYLVLVLAYILLLLPSIYPSLPVAEIPNMARTATVLPIVFFWITTGLMFVYRQASKHGKSVGVVWLVGCLALISTLNLYKYFVQYPQVQPNQNAAYSKLIARYIDGLPADTNIEFNSCCWGDFGHAERKAIYYQLKNPQSRNRFDLVSYVTECDQIQDGRRSLIFFKPEDENFNKFRACFPEAKSYTHKMDGLAIFSAVEFD